MDTFRKWLNKPKADDKSLLARFYHADRALTAISSELDSFDGRAEPERCSRLVGKLRQGQDRVLAITNQIMDELLGEDRAARAFRSKFPEEVVQESLGGQLWFGAECLAAGSSIMNREYESAEMRPLARAVTKSLDTVRNLLREQCLRNNIPNSPTLKLDLNDAATEALYESLKIFDRLFADFELVYVSAMVQVKTKQEYEMQELICVLFSESLQRALKLGLLEQEQVDAFDPSIMFSIPRLAIVAGLVIFKRGPLNMDMPPDELSELFRPFRTLLIKIRELLRTLNKKELYQLEKLLCTNEEIHLKNNLNCDDDKKANSDENLINNVINKRESATSTNPLCLGGSDVGVEGELPENVEVEGNDGDDEDDDVANYEPKDNLAVADCASGYLIPNTNLGNLLQINDGPLTNNIVGAPNEFSLDDEECESATALVPEQSVASKSGVQQSNADSGVGTASPSLDRTPDSENLPVATTSVLSGRSQCESISTRNRRTRDEFFAGMRKDANSNTSQEGESDKPTEWPERVVVRLKEQPSSSAAASRTRRRNRPTHQDVSSSSESLSSTPDSPSTSSSSYGSTTSSQSDADAPINLALRAAGRMKFKSTGNLLHRLFVCIAGVADQLQTNFASDLRQILRSVFLINTSPPQDEVIAEKPKDNELFEFRASENDVIQPNAGSNQSIYSAEEVNPESNDSVFDTHGTRGGSVETELRGARNPTERSRSLGEAPSNYCEESPTNIRQRHSADSRRVNSVRERSNSQSQPSAERSQQLRGGTQSGNNSPSNSRGSINRGRNLDGQSESQDSVNRLNTVNNREHPPRWVPDEEAPRCMACSLPFTTFRRRHHCRNCGGVFCSVCSNATTPLPKFGLIKAVRVCRNCYVLEVGSA